MRLPLAVLISGLLLATAPATAADNGFFLGAGIGQMNTEVDDVWGSDFNFDEDDFGFKLFGGYKFFPWLSVEGAFIDGGKPEVKYSYPEFDASERLTIEVQSLVAAAVFSLSVGERVELFVKPGIAYWTSDTTYSFSEPGDSGSIKDDDNGSAFFLGAGVGFNFTENLGVRLEYEWFEVAPEWDSDYEEFVDEYDATAGFLSASFVYSF